MVLHEEQHRVKTLLTDTITLLCRNGLTFKSEFNISALIGITLDKENVFLVDIRETIKHHPPSEDEDSDASSVASTEHSKQNRRRRRRKRSAGSLGSANSGSDDDQSEPAVKRTSDIKQESVKIDDGDSQDLVFVKNEPGNTPNTDYPGQGLGNSNQNSFSASAAITQGNSSQSSMYNSPMSELPSAITPNWESFAPTLPPGSQPSTSMQQGPQLMAIPGSDPGQSMMMMIKPTQTRRTHTVDKRYAIIKEVEEGMMKKTHIARKYNIPQNTLSTWIKNADKIKEGYENATFSGMLKMRSGSFPDVEKSLKEWVVLMESHGQYVSQQAMREKAQQIALSLGHQDFRGSSTWLRQFKRRNGWIKRKRSEVGLGNAGFIRRDSSGRSDSAWKMTGEHDTSLDTSNSDPPVLPPTDNKLEQVRTYNPNPVPTTSSPSPKGSLYKPVVSQGNFTNPAPSQSSSHSRVSVPGTGPQSNCYAAGYSEPAPNAEYNEFATAVAAAVIAQQRADSEQVQSVGQSVAAPSHTQSIPPPSTADGSPARDSQQNENSSGN